MALDLSTLAGGSSPPTETAVLTHQLSALGQKQSSRTSALQRGAGLQMLLDLLFLATVPAWPRLWALLMLGCGKAAAQL